MSKTDGILSYQTIVGEFLITTGTTHVADFSSFFVKTRKREFKIECFIVYSRLN